MTELIEEREELIDHLFYRTVQLLLLILAGVLIILLVWKRLGSWKHLGSKNVVA